MTPAPLWALGDGFENALKDPNKINELRPFSSGRSRYCTNDPLSTQFSTTEKTVPEVAEMYCVMNMNGERFLQ
jgi:hypothetical protein